MPAPVVVLDFDGVINMLGSGRAVRRAPGALGHVKLADIECDGVIYQVRYSREVVKRLAIAIRDSGSELWWLTTWNECTQSSLDPELGFKSSGWNQWDLLDALIIKPDPSIGLDAHEVRVVEEFLGPASRYR